jgi:hypothetical protein
MFGVGVQISPGEQFPLAYQIADPNDTTTYFVKSTVFNALTNKVIATVPLTDLGNGFFSKSYTVPPDPSGLGSYINVRTEVYLDSGYVTPSPNYEIDTTTYLVQLRVPSSVAFGGGAGGGGADVDYRKIEDIIERKLPKQKRIKELDLIPRIIELIAALSAEHEDYRTMMAEQLQAMMSGMIDSVSSVGGKVEKYRFDPELLREPAENVQRLRREIVSNAASLAEMARNGDEGHETTRSAMTELIEALSQDLGVKLELNRRDLSSAFLKNLSGIERFVYSKVPKNVETEKNNDGRIEAEKLAERLAQGF